MPETCKAMFPTVDGELVCSLPAGHDGPVHRASSGEEWGDSNLVISTEPDAPVPTDGS